MWQWFAVALVALMITTAPAAAQDRLDAAAAALTRATAQPRDEAVALGRMGGLLGVTPEALRAQRTSAGLGWGDFFVAQRIAARGGHPVDKVFAARRTGAGWSAIAEEANVRADLLVQDVAVVWPDAARASTVPVAPSPSATATPPAGVTAPAQKDEPKGLGARMRELLGGTPPTGSGDRSTDRAAEDIRDQMIRGGGSRSR
jgi:hypothetical protein